MAKSIQALCNRESTALLHCLCEVKASAGKPQSWLITNKRANILVPAAFFFQFTKLNENFLHGFINVFSLCCTKIHVLSVNI